MLSARKIALLGIDSPMVAMLCATEGFVSSATIPVPLPLPAPPIYLGGGGGSGVLWMPTWPAPISSSWWKRPEDLVRELEEKTRAEREAQEASAEQFNQSRNNEHVVADTIIDSHGIERQVRIRYDDDEKEALKDKGTNWLAERVIMLEGKDLARESALNWTVTNGQRTFRFFVHKPYPKDDNPTFPQAKMLPSILLSAAVFALMWVAGHD